MNNLLDSRTVKDEQASKLENLSPQKYGKAAFASLSYTPSKLADNVLFKEVTTLKKFEESANKLRQTETMNSVFQDRLLQMQEEKDGIEKALNIQISMYKKMLKETEEKNDQRIKQMQDNYNLQISGLIEEKEEEAKFAQSEKELLEGRIEELEEILAQLREELNHGGSNLKNLQNQNQQLTEKNEAQAKRIAELEEARRRQQERAKQEIEELKRTIHSNNLEAKARLDSALNEKQKQLENQERLHRTELEKVESQRANEAMLKNQELKDLAATFEKQTARLNNIISKKEEAIDYLNRNVEAEKQKAFAQAKSYQNEISNLAHEKSRLKEELMKSERRVEKLQAENSLLTQELSAASSGYKDEIENLKKDLQYNQVNYMREVDKNTMVCEDLEKQMARLRMENEQAAFLAGENSTLHRELRNMKELLMESSLEMERCKEEFIRLGREKDLLVIKLKEMGIENETLYKLKNEREDEARGWRENYLLHKAAY